MQAIDHQNRLDSLDPLSSVCVTAPAGSGKTELLIQRVLVLLARVNHPEEILAITFTRKAASEMHQRIVSALELARGSAEPVEEHKRLTWDLARKAIARNDACGWQLLDNPNRLRIQTIDGFCASLTRQMPILSKFGTQPKIATSADKYYRLAAQAFLGSLESDGPVADSLALLMIHLDNNMGRVEDLLVSLLERRDQWLVHIVFAGYATEIRAGLEATAAAVIKDTLTVLSEELGPYTPDLLPLLDYAGTNLLAQQANATGSQLAGIIELPPNDSSSITLWLAVADMLLTAQNRWRKTVTIKNGFPTQTLDGEKSLAKERKDKFSGLLKELSNNQRLLDTLIDLRHLPSAQFSQSQWRLLESLSILLPVLTAELQTVFQQYAEVDYIQVSIAALESLGGDKSASDLLMKLDYQLYHILVDEFQDTATSQYELLKKLVEGWEEHNYLNPKAPKTLFIVGDGMQSIYGFRAANVGLFLEARTYGVNSLQLNNLPLSVNFRSRPSVVDWINKTFKHSFPATDNISRGAVKYESSSAFKPTAEDAGVHIDSFTGENASQNEASYIAGLVAELQASNPDQTIAILVRSRSHLVEILPALQKAGLKWEANDIDPLVQYPFISDLLILTRALDNCHDRIAWAALLRSPLCGLDNTDLHAVLGQEYTTVSQAIYNSATISSLSPFAKKRLKFISDVVQPAIDQRLRRPFRVWVEGVWMKLGGASLLSELNQFDHVDDYLNLLEQSEHNGALNSIDEFEDSMHKLYASSSSNSSLQLMTIHKAKGLEFDTVILPKLSKSTRGNAKTLLMWREYLSGEHNGLLISPMAAIGEAQDNTYNHLYFEQSIAASLEMTRLLYVACTRAVERLHLTFCLDDESKLPGKNTLLHSIWPSVQDSVLWHAENVVHDEQLGLDFQEQESSSHNLLRISSTWKPPQWNFHNPLANYVLPTQTLEGKNRPIYIDNQIARVVGTVVHLVLESLVSTGCQHWNEMNSEYRFKWISQLFLSKGLYKKNLETYVTQVKSHIDNIISDKQGRWILANDYSLSHCELALLGENSGQVTRKVIDRCFVDEAGDFWIIDYKTGQPRDGQTTDDYIVEETNAYTEQLQGYKGYVESCYDANTYKSIRLALYFTALPFFQEIH